MKKKLYYSIIGIGVILAIIGFAASGFSPIWGILIAAVSAITYVVNTQNEKKVQERLQDEQGMFQRDEAETESGEPGNAESSETPDAGEEKQE